MILTSPINIRVVFQYMYWFMQTTGSIELVPANEIPQQVRLANYSILDHSAGILLRWEWYIGIEPEVGGDLILTYQTEEGMDGRGDWVKSKIYQSFLKR